MKTRGFSLCLGFFLCSALAFAQPVPSSLKASDYSDADILALVEKAQAQGLSPDQVEQLALAQGMAASEVAAFKARVSGLTQTPTSVTSEANAASVIAATNQNEAIEEQVFTTPKPSASNEVFTTPKPSASNEVFGQGLYRNTNLAVYDRSLDAKAPANYEIGIGDEIGISLFGNSYYNQVCPVDNRGRIELGRNLGSVYVKGVTFENAKALIRSALASTSNLSGSQLEISLAYSRSIVVHMVGEVSNPGSYKIPAMNTVFNALLAAGGPSNMGSLRQIEVRRNGEVVHIFDTYSFLKDPSNAVFLQDNDYILVKPMGAVVNLTGAVKRNASYELKAGEGMAELLDYAGGATANAYLPIVYVQRYENKSQRVYTVNYDSLKQAGQSLLFQNGDRVYVQENSADVENGVSVSGPVYFAGPYALEEGDRVTELLQKAGGLKPEAFTARAFLVRRFDDGTVSHMPIDLNKLEPNYTLQKRDQLLVFALSEYTDDFQVAINGEVRKPGSFAYKEGMTLGDVVLLAGGLAMGAEIEKVEIARSNLFSPNYVSGEAYKTEIISLVVSKNPAEANTVWQTPLYPQDIVSVRRVPNYELQQTVQVLGEVKYPGTYVLLNKNMRIQDLVVQAGGLTPYAFAQGARFQRPTAPGQWFVFDLPKALRNKRSEYNYKLEGGDVLRIPTTQDFVTVYGSALKYSEDNTNSKNILNTPYVSGKRAAYYVRHFGNGYTPRAWRSKTYVLAQNGQLHRTFNAYVFRISPKVEPGAEVFVLNKETKDKNKEKLKKATDPVNWENVINSITTKLTAFATLWALLTQ
ncbi:MAG: SLBB domain-containing protein [Bacteroidetes bacterium]|nr:SLBB domain-containing protein [Bacteroidota bacterium]